MKLKLPERRRFVRLEAPLDIKVFRAGKTEKLTTKNISPMGFMVETGESFDKDQELTFELKVAEGAVPVGIKGRVIWQNKTSLADGAPYNVGVDIVEVDNPGKNDFLKYLCDLLYGSEYKERT